MSDVTVAGPSGTPITIPVTSTGNQALTQAALSAISDQITAGLKSGTLTLTQVSTPGAETIPAGSGSTSGAVIVGAASSGGALYELTVPTNFGFLLASGDVTVTAAPAGDPTIAAVGGADLVFDNSSFASILLEGGQSYIAQMVSTASAVIDVQGSDTFGVGGAVIDAQLGSTTVNLYNNSASNIETGGNILVTAQAGTEVLELSGASTVPVTISGTASSDLWLLNQANAFIEPGAGSILIIPGSTGSATLFGGTATFGGKTFKAPAFTGSATVFGGTGYYQGGAAGNNVLLSSTVAGATTLIGGGNNDLLASYASGNTLIGGSGNEVLVGANTTGTGNDFISGTGSDTIWGSGSGNNTIGFGSDSTFAYGQHGTGGPLTGNVYYQAAGGGVDNIGDFLPGKDVFSLSLSARAENVSAVTVLNLQVLRAGRCQPLRRGRYPGNPFRRHHGQLPARRRDQVQLRLKPDPAGLITTTPERTAHRRASVRWQRRRPPGRYRASPAARRPLSPAGAPAAWR